MDLILHCADGEHAIASYGRFIIQVWSGVPTRARLERGFEIVDSVHATLGVPIGTLAVMEESSSPPPTVDLEWAKVRAAAASGLIAGMAGVFERPDGPPLDRDAREEMAAGLGTRIPMRVCFDVDEACAWLARRITPEAADSGVRRALARAVETTRAAVVSSR